jgi:PAS domain-containing protein
MDMLDLDSGEKTDQKKTRVTSNVINGLSAIDAILNLERNKELTTKEILQQAVNLIPAGLQHSENACACVLIDGQRFTSSDFRETQWKQVRSFAIDHNQEGLIEVYYPEDKYIQASSGDGAHDLLFLDTAGKCLSLLLKNRNLKEDLDKSHDFISLISRKINEILFVTDINGVILYVSHAIAELTGYEISELLGQRITRYIENSEKKIFGFNPNISLSLITFTFIFKI